MAEFISTTITIVILIVVVWILLKIFNGQKRKEGYEPSLITNEIEKRREEDKKTCERRIPLDDFGVGPIKMKEYRSANLCNDKVLYPINGLDVNYGSKMPGNCPCQQFIQPP